jgi:hypothetical protein
MRESMATCKNASDPLPAFANEMITDQADRDERPEADALALRYSPIADAFTTSSRFRGHSNRFAVRT